MSNELTMNEAIKLMERAKKQARKDFQGTVEPNMVKAKAYIFKETGVRSVSVAVQYSINEETFEFTFTPFPASRDEIFKKMTEHIAQNIAKEVVRAGFDGIDTGEIAR